MKRGRRLQALDTLPWLAWRHHRRRPLALAGAAATACLGAALAGAMPAAGQGGVVMAAGAAAAMAALLGYLAWWRGASEERAADRRLLATLGVGRGALRFSAALEAALPALAGGAPGLLLGERLGGWLAQHPTAASSAGLSTAAPDAFAAWLLAAGLVAALLAWALERALLFASGTAARAGGWPLALRAAAGQLTRGRRRVAAAATALALTLAAVLALRGAEGPLEASLAAWLDQSVTWDVLVAAPAAGAAAEAGLDLDTLTRLLAVPDVAEAVPERKATVGSRGRSVPVVAIDPGVTSGGTRLSAIDGQGHGPGSASLTSGDVVALSVPLARRLAVGVGDELPLSTPSGERPYRVVALVEERGGGEAAYLDLMSYATAFDDRQLDSITVRLGEGTDVHGVASELAAQPGVGSVTTADEYRNGLLLAAGTFHQTALRAALVALLLALAGLVAAAARAARGRRAERALFSALGAPGWLEGRSVAVEVGLAVATACLLGALLGAGVNGYLGMTGEPGGTPPLGQTKAAVAIVATAAFAWLAWRWLGLRRH